MSWNNPNERHFPAQPDQPKPWREPQPASPKPSWQNDRDNDRNQPRDPWIRRD
jgi:hypothetical protein